MEELNLENRRDLADWTHPVDLIEPIEEPDLSEAVKTLQQLIRRVFEVRGAHALPLPRRIEVAFRRFVAIAYLVDQKVVADGLPALKIAEALGMTRAGFSKLVLEWSDGLLGGFKAAGMKGEAARRAYSAVQQGHKGYRGMKRSDLVTGTAKKDKTLERVRQRVIRNALVDFVEGRDWTKADSTALAEAGLIDRRTYQLTTAGRARVAELKQVFAKRMSKKAKQMTA